MIIARIPRLLKNLSGAVTWAVQTEERRVYLTFDDGPTPEVTEWVLKTLKKYNAKATFFCLGNNVEAHPGIYHQILEDGHSVGNHSYSHVKGFRTGLNRYVSDVEQASGLIHSRLFRPPYGRILPRQVRALKKKFRIVMWTVLSVDYNASLPGDQVVKNVISNVSPGSIIVFHDSVKAWKNLNYALPRVLQYLDENGYTSESLDPGTR